MESLATKPAMAETAGLEGFSKATCRFCGSNLKHTFVDLGMSPLCESYLSMDQLNQMEPFYPLYVYVCDQCYQVQLEEYVTPEHIFTEYAYFSSYATSWLEHVKKYTHQMIDRFRLDKNSFVVEVASNDGYLLLTVNGGTPHTVTANYSGSGTFDPSSGSLSPAQTVDPATSTTTVSCPGSVVYTGTPFTPCSETVTGAGGLSLTPTPNYSNNTNFGTATASYTYAGDANHLGSMDSKNFSITKATSSVAVAPLSTQYDGTVKTTTAVVSGVGTGITQIVTWSYSGNCSSAPVNVAETPCTARADYAGDTSWRILPN